MNGSWEQAKTVYKTCGAAVLRFGWVGMPDHLSKMVGISGTKSTDVECFVCNKKRTCNSKKQT